MRRKPLKKASKKSDFYSAYTIKPWLWKTCQLCGDEMKREEVHHISITWTEKRCGPSGGCTVKIYGRGEVDNYYFCNNCCPTLADAQRSFEEKFFPLYYPYWRDDESSES